MCSIYKIVYAKNFLTNLKGKSLVFGSDTIAIERSGGDMRTVFLLFFAFDFQSQHNDRDCGRNCAHIWVSLFLHISFSTFLQNHDLLKSRTIYPQLPQLCQYLTNCLLVLLLSPFFRFLSLFLPCGFHPGDNHLVVPIGYNLHLFLL